MTNHLSIINSKIAFLHSKLFEWIDTYALRKYPWREGDCTQFQVLVTEVLLRRTKSGNVERVWYDFFNEFQNYEDIIKKAEKLREYLLPLGLVNLRFDTLTKLSKELSNNPG